jgi:cell division protein ZapB
MDTLTRLEERIDSFMGRVRVLEEENRRLKQEAEAAMGELTAENRRLAEELERERSGKEAVLSRIDGLLSKLQGEGL